MKKLMSWFKEIRLRQMVMVFLAGVVLVINTACANTQMGRGNSNDPSTGPSSASGMNRYSDIDPRTNTKATAAQVKGLKDKTEANVIDMTDDVSTNTERILDKKADNLEHLGQNLKKDTQTLTTKSDRVATEAKRATEDLGDTAKAKTKAGLKGEPNAVSSSGRDLGKVASRTVEDTYTGVRDTLNSNQVAERAQGAINSVQSAAKKAVKGTERAAQSATDTVTGNHA